MNPLSFTWISRKVVENVIFFTPLKALSTVPYFKDLFGILGPYWVLISFGGSACGLFKAGLIYLFGLPESMG